MIEIWGIGLAQLPERRTLFRLLNEEYAEAWHEKHKSVREERAARAGLGGLLLLQLSGTFGTLSYDQKGRPYLKNSDVDFNITHTAQYVLCAVENMKNGPTLPEPPPSAGYPVQRVPRAKEALLFSDRCRVGVDIENLSRLRTTRICPLADRFFSEREALFFQKEPTDERFLRVWTRKEALGKWLGNGLADIRELDTVTAPFRYGIRFYEYRLEDSVVALCCHASSPPPPSLRMVTSSELMALM